MNRFNKVKMVCLLTIICGVANLQATTWTNMQGGDWNDAANWNDGVPDGSDARLTGTTASYLVTVGTPPFGVINSLYVNNSSANTTRLDIAASGFTVSNGYINIGHCGEVRVAGGGEWVYTGNSSPTENHIANVEKNGLLWIDGGTVAFTNLLKMPVASRMRVGSTSVGRMAITDGTFAMNGSLKEKNASAEFYLGNLPNGDGHLKVSGTGRAEFAGGYGATIYIGNAGGDGHLEVSDTGRVEFGKTYLGNFTNSYGHLEVSGTGRAEFAGVYDTYIGNKGGYGHLEVSDTGRVEFGSALKSILFNVGAEGGTGIVDLKDHAELEFLGLNNTVYIANGAGSTGKVTVAGNAKFLMQASENKTSFYTGMDLGSSAEITVCDNGVMDIYGGLYFCLGGPDTLGRSVLTVKDQGSFEAGGGLSMCLVEGNGTAGYAEINLEGGTLSVMNCLRNQGLYVGRVNAEGSGFAQACVNISGGFLNLMRDYVSHNWGARGGILVGMVAKSATGGAQGEFNLSGGAVTNFGALTLGLGQGATGTLCQTGGTFIQGRVKANVFRNVVIGWCGSGSYCMSGGTMLVYDEVYLGGVTTNQVPRINEHGQYFSMDNTGKGLLQVDSGSFTVTNNKTLFCGSNGEGTIVIGSNGVCAAKNIVLTNNLQSVVRFEFGKQGCGVLRATDTLQVCAGTKLEVDAQAYTGGEVWIKLIEHATRDGAFATEDITVTGHGHVIQTAAGVWLHRPKGTIILIY